MAALVGSAAKSSCGTDCGARFHAANPSEEAWHLDMHGIDRVQTHPPRDQEPPSLKLSDEDRSACGLRNWLGAKRIEVGPSHSSHLESHEKDPE